MKNETPRCYCSPLTVCDFCNGYRHPLSQDLQTPRDMKMVAGFLGCSIQDLVRMSVEEIRVASDAKVNELKCT